MMDSIITDMLFHCPVCRVLKGQKNGHFPLSCLPVPDGTGRSCRRVPSVRDRRDTQTGHFHCPVCPSCFSETAAVNHRTEPQLTFLMPDTFCSDKLFKTIPPLLSVSGSFKLSFSLSLSNLFRFSFSAIFIFNKQKTIRL